MDAGHFGGLFPLVATGHPHPRWRSELYTQGLAQIETALAQCQQWAQRPRPWLATQITRGRIRELHAARRLITWLWRPGAVLAPAVATPPALPSGERLSQVRQKFNQPLTNTSNLLLETDLLRFEKQRELWNTILNRWEALLAELLEARITPEALTPVAPSWWNGCGRKP